MMKLKISHYLNGWFKRAFDLITGLFMLLFSLPLMFFIFLLILLSTGWPVIFVQERVGKNGRVFKLYKFRTMYLDAERDRDKYIKLNEADGPVFKVKNDPRFVGFGKWLSRTGLDELPQLVNVLKGDMSLVGPRPLPVVEANEVGKEYYLRQEVKPGMTSWWQITGAHSQSFKTWMNLDVNYCQQSSFILDIVILFKTFNKMLNWIIVRK